MSISFGNMYICLRVLICMMKQCCMLFVSGVASCILKLLPGYGDSVFCLIGLSVVGG